MGFVLMKCTVFAIISVKMMSLLRILRTWEVALFDINSKEIN